MLQIPDEFYTQAAGAIIAARSFVQDASEIEKVLRSYVYLGQNKKIPDFDTSGLTQDEQTALVNAVIDRTQSFYSVRFKYADVVTILAVMQDMISDASTGGVPYNIGKPRAAEEAFELELTEAHANDKNPVTKGIDNFFSGAGKGVGDALQAMLNGLGFDIPLSTLVYIIAGIFVLFLIVKFRK